MGLNMFFRTTTIDLLPSSDLLSPMGLVKTNSHGHHGHHVLEMGSCSGTVFSRVFLRYVIFNMLSPRMACSYLRLMVVYRRKGFHTSQWANVNSGGDGGTGSVTNFLRRHKSRLGVPKSQTFGQSTVASSIWIGSELHKGENWWKLCIPEHLINTILQLFRWYFRHQYFTLRSLFAKFMHCIIFYPLMESGDSQKAGR